MCDESYTTNAGRIEGRRKWERRYYLITHETETIPGQGLDVML
jgi:hypothetical protein